MNGDSSPITRAKRVETAQESIRDGQINKCGFPHTGGYYGAIDVDAALIQATAGMDFMLSDRMQVSEGPRVGDSLDVRCPES